jgi:hypothetical protein
MRENRLLPVGWPGKVRVGEKGSQAIRRRFCYFHATFGQFYM